MYARDRFVAFVDILGFSALIEDVEKLGHGDFSRPLELTQALGSESDSEKFKHRFMPANSCH